MSVPGFVCFKRRSEVPNTEASGIAGGYSRFQTLGEQKANSIAPCPSRQTPTTASKGALLVAATLVAAIRLRGEPSILRDQVLPLLRNEPGFVDLISFVSDEQPDHALGIALWKSQEDAHRFYTHSEPMSDVLKPLVTRPPVVEHYNVETSLFQYAPASKAA